MQTLSLQARGPHRILHSHHDARSQGIHVRIPLSPVKCSSHHCFGCCVSAGSRLNLRVGTTAKDNCLGKKQLYLEHNRVVTERGWWWGKWGIFSFTQGAQGPTPHKWGGGGQCPSSPHKHTWKSVWLRAVTSWPWGDPKGRGKIHSPFHKHCEQTPNKKTGI